MTCLHRAIIYVSKIFPPGDFSLPLSTFCIEGVKYFHASLSPFLRDKKGLHFHHFLSLVPNAFVGRWLEFNRAFSTLHIDVSTLMIAFTSCSMRPLSPLLFWPIKFISVVSNFRKCLQIECAIRSVANVRYILIYFDSVQKNRVFQVLETLPWYWIFVWKHENFWWFSKTVQFLYSSYFRTNLDLLL